MQRMSAIVRTFVQLSKRYYRLEHILNRALTICVLIGSACSRSILDGYAPLYISRLYLQWNVHTKEHCRNT